MKCLMLAAFSVLLLADTPARSEVVEIPMPALVGDYADQPVRDRRLTGRTVVVDLGRPVAAVNGAWMQWSGEVHAGWGSCNGSVFRWIGGLGAKFNNRGLFAWTAAIPARDPDYDVTFNQTTPFESALDPGWSFLEDGVDSLIVSTWGANYFCGEMLAPVTAVIESATLILDVDFGPVAIEPTTWGRVKALYADGP